MKVKPALLSALLFIVFLFSCCVNPLSIFASDWPMFRLNPNHTGFNTEETEMKPPLEVKWELDTDYGFSSAVVKDGVVYVRSGNPTILYALDGKTGSEKWKYQSSLNSHTSPAVAEGLVFTGNPCAGCSLEAINTADGSLVWKTPTLTQGARDPNYLDGVIYFGSDDNYVRARRTADGAVIWNILLSGGMVTVPALANGKVFIGTSSGILYALDAVYGSISWQYDVSPYGVLESSPTIINDSVYFASGNKTVYSLNLNTGTEKWKFSNTTDSVWSSPAVANGILYIQDLAGAVFALDTETGKLLWDFQSEALPSTSYSSPAVANGVVYVGSTDGVLYALDALNGDLLWSYQTGGPIIASPVVADGMVYVGSQGDKFYAFGPKEEFLDIPWDYQSKNLGFEDSLLLTNSLFDHEYPLMWNEPSETDEMTMTFSGFEDDEDNVWYSGHNGYDYGKKVKLVNGDPVLAPADGIAKYRRDNCGGNTIVIDHKNGYFSWFMHLQNEGLVASTSAGEVEVKQSDAIGLMGNSGSNTDTDGNGEPNCPTMSPHLHMSIVKDLNENGLLDFGPGNDYPDGLADPLGWDPYPDFSDPWLEKVDLESKYLYKNSLEEKTEEIPPEGAVFSLGRFQITFPNDQTRPNMTIVAKLRPSVNGSFRLRGVSYALDIFASEKTGNPVENFNEPLLIEVGYGDYDIENYEEAALQLYWFNEDSKEWEALETDVDPVYDILTAQVNHFSQFMVMGEALDTEAPETTAVFTGEEGEEDWFRSDVEVALSSEDNPGGSGVEYLFYSFNLDGDWEIYEEPLDFTEEGEHVIYAYAVDRADNIESLKEFRFHIDKTLPEFSVHYNPESPSLVFSAIEEGDSIEVLTDSQRAINVIVGDKAGNRLEAEGNLIEAGPVKHLSFISFSYNREDEREFEKNRMQIIDKTNSKTKSSRNLQQFWHDGKDWGKLFYQANDDQSILMEKESGEKISTEIQDGLVILRMRTAAGNLIYEY